MHYFNIQVGDPARGQWKGMDLNEFGEGFIADKILGGMDLVESVEVGI